MPASSDHVLLIGIDAYPRKALRGCVNDIDAMERVLIGWMGVPADDITRLASPRIGTLHRTTLPEAPATLANIRAALSRLSSAEVKPADRVFIYYSGHGARVPVVS